MKGNSFSLGIILLKLRTFIALIVVLVVFSLITPSFLTVTNLVVMLKHSAIWAILAMGMTYVIVSGGIDLSVGSVSGLVGMLAGGFFTEGLVLPMFGIVIYFHTWMIIILALAIGAGIGFINSVFITKFGVAPFIATLGTMYMARGFALLRSGGKTFPNLIGKPELGNTGFPFLGSGHILGLPISIWIMTFLGITAAYVFTKTPLGRHIYALGGNERAAKLSGIRVNRLKTFTYMFSGFCAAFVGLIITSELVASHPSTGETFELTAIAAAVLGGTSLSGGRGTIGGAIIGALIIGVLTDGLIMVGVSSFWQTVIKGMVVVGAVMIDQYQLKKQNEAALKDQSAYESDD